MGSGIFFPVAAIPFSIVIISLFFLKGHIKTDETKIYSRLIVLNFIGLIIEIFCSYACQIHDTYTLLSEIILKTYLVYLISWTIVFTYYIYKISNIKIGDNIVKAGFLFSDFVFSVIIYLLPIDVVIDKQRQIQYTTGLSANFAYVLSGIFVLMILMMLIKNYKNLKSKKYLPVYLFFVIGTASIIIQMIFPQLLLFTYFETFICVVMYFTIENPDLAMIEQLNEARDQADKANNAKSEFLSNMSHEIRTPLNAIVGFSQALEEEELPDSAKEEVSDIIMASRSLLEIVNGILDISKIEANKLEIVNSEYDLNKILKELTSLAKARLGEKPVQFNTNFDPTIPNVLYGDHTRIKQIVLNLLTNAVKYTHEGHIDFKVSSVISGDVCRLIFSVEDTGIGIKEDNIPKIFSKFERFDLDKNITIEGTGLGMAITKRLIDLMNGKIVVQSIYGKGSKFTVAIDQKIVKTPTIEVKQDATVKEVATFDVSGKRILVVDDNKLNLKVAERLLRDYNVVVDTLDRGGLCVEKIQSGEKYDLILMDDMMPNMSGTETLQKLKEIEGFNTPTIALTANAITGMKEKYLNAGFDDYLSKPIDKLELNRVINDFLNK